VGNKWQDAIANSGGDDIRRLKVNAPAKGEKTKLRIRIIDNNFEDAWVHFFPGFKENGEKGVRFAVCHGKGKCPICAKFEESGDEDFKAKRQFYMNVIDRKAEKPQVMVYQCGFGTFKDIAALTDEDSGLTDPSEFDVIITRVGSKKTDTRYTIKPFMKDGVVVKKKLPSDLRELIAAKTEDGGPYDLSKFVEKVSIDDIEEMLTGNFSSKAKGKKKDDDEDDEDEKPKKKGKKYAADDDEDEDDKPKKKKKSSDDDEDDEDEDEKPKKKSKKDEDEDDDEDEDEKPKKKGKKKDDEDEDEDEKPRKKSKKKDDDDEDEDEDEDEKPKKKGKSKSDDDDEDEDEDEDEKPRKKSKSKKDDDDDEDED